jgi:hypothetical protein
MKGLVGECGYLNCDPVPARARVYDFELPNALSRRDRLEPTLSGETGDNSDLPLDGDRRILPDVKASSKIVCPLGADYRANALKHSSDRAVGEYGHGSFVNSTR